MGSRQEAPGDSAVPPSCPTAADREMEAIKKKMQAMKVEKDNACDRVDASEEQCKAARLRASKAEDEVDELVTKSRQLEILELEEEVRVVANSLKSLEVAEEKANQ